MNIWAGGVNFHANPRRPILSLTVPDELQTRFQIQGFWAPGPGLPDTPHQKQKDGLLRCLEDFDILLDLNGDVQRAMNVANPPVTFLIDQNGKIVYTHTGYVEGDEYELEEKIKEAHKP